ncbi:hypothetical protein Tco_0754224 [Tanacetum coccineum]
MQVHVTTGHKMAQLPENKHAVMHQEVWRVGEKRREGRGGVRRRKGVGIEGEEERVREGSREVEELGGGIGVVREGEEGGRIKVERGGKEGGGREKEGKGRKRVEGKVRVEVVTLLDTHKCNK